jgi:cytochrome c553
VRFRIKALIFFFLGAVPIAAGAADGSGPHTGGDEVAAALRLTPNLKNGLRVYEVCAACHTPEGGGNRDGSVPVVAGQHRTVIIKQLADIRAGNRDVPDMFPFAAPKTLGGVQSIADVAGYISRLPLSADSQPGPGKNLERGGRLYRTHCLRCHGAGGEGNGERFYPRIQGQHYAYLVRQFIRIRDGVRRNANAEMVSQIKGFSSADMTAVLDYVSRLKPGPGRVAPKGWKNPDFKRP